MPSKQRPDLPAALPPEVAAYYQPFESVGPNDRRYVARPKFIPQEDNSMRVSFLAADVVDSTGQKWRIRQYSPRRDNTGALGYYLVVFCRVSPILNPYVATPTPTPEPAAEIVARVEVAIRAPARIIALPLEEDNMDPAAAQSLAEAAERRLAKALETVSKPGAEVVIRRAAGGGLEWGTVHT